MERWARGKLQQVLTATCWFDPGQAGKELAAPFSVTVSFTGRRAGVTGRPGPGDSFAHQETVPYVVPGSGPAAVTARVRGINAGAWTVTAEPAAAAGHPPVMTCPPDGCHYPLLARQGSAQALAGRPAATATTAPLAVRVPGTVRYGWAVLMFLGMAAGLGVEAAVLARARIPAAGMLWISVLAILAGLVGGKAWYVAEHRGRDFDGWCIQGAVLLGSGVGVVCLLAASLGRPLGTYLDIAAPGALIGMAIGRVGCLLAGCCAGRPTASRWGVWSSDGRLGVRRIPTQLLEAALALGIGLAALALVWLRGPGRDGLVFVGALAAYTLGRQPLLPLRAESRLTSFGRPVTAALAAAVLISAVLAAAA